MSKGFFQLPVAVNEPVKSYAPGSPEREEVLLQYRAYYKSKSEIPLYIGEHEIALGGHVQGIANYDRYHRDTGLHGDVKRPFLERCQPR